MIQHVILGIWVCLATLGGVYGADFLFAPSGSDQVQVSGMSYSRVKPITVPVLRGGIVDGYVVAKFVYGIRKNADKHVAERVEPHFIDSVFRVLYSQEPDRISRKGRTDFDRLRNEILQRVNKSLGESIVEEALVEQLNYVSAEQVRCSKKVP